MNSSIDHAIDKYGFYIATPIGTSMLPLLRERIDTVKLVKPSNIKKYDVILYRRSDNTLVLHRIIKIKEDKFYLCGDNQTVIEKGITKDMIIAVMDGFYKKEKYISKTKISYQFYVINRVLSRPLRKFISNITKLFKKIISRG